MREVSSRVPSIRLNTLRARNSSHPTVRIEHHRVLTIGGGWLLLLSGAFVKGESCSLRVHAWRFSLAPPSSGVLRSERNPFNPSHFAAGRGPISGGSSFPFSWISIPSCRRRTWCGTRDGRIGFDSTPESRRTRTPLISASRLGAGAYFQRVSRGAPGIINRSRETD